MSRGYGKTQRDILDYLDGRGWTTVRTLARVATNGRVDNVNRALRRLALEGCIERTGWSRDGLGLGPAEPPTGGAGYWVRLSEVKESTGARNDLT